MKILAIGLLLFLGWCSPSVAGTIILTGHPGELIDWTGTAGTTVDSGQPVIFDADASVLNRTPGSGLPGASAATLLSPGRLLTAAEFRLIPIEEGPITIAAELMDGSLTEESYYLDHDGEHFTLRAIDGEAFRKIGVRSATGLIDTLDNVRLGVSVSEGTTIVGASVGFAVLLMHGIYRKIA